ARWHLREAVPQSGGHRDPRERDFHQAPARAGARRPPPCTGRAGVSPLERQHVTFAPVDVDAVEIRVLGCLIEKQRTTPDAYPLSLNSLRLACNQTTNRDPVVVYEDREIKAALDRLSNRGWTRFASGASSRALKYRHLFDEALSLSGEEISLLGVLMLRGPQTVG